jgi:hypothetical protein
LPPSSGILLGVPLLANLLELKLLMTQTTVPLVQIVAVPVVAVIAGAAVVLHPRPHIDQPDDHYEFP